MANGSLYTDIQQNIATIEFGHPQANSFPLELLNRLEKELNTLSQNPEVHLIILRSEGEKTFCSGASLDELLQIQTPEQGTQFFSGFARVINAMRTCSQLIIGRAQGKSVGGGVGLLAACDYVFATEQASVKLSEIAIGIGPFVITPALERKIGVGALAELTLSTEWQNAYWAQKKGLFARVFKTIEEMDKEIAFFAQRLASYSPEALAQIKKSFWKDQNHWGELLLENAKISGEMVLSDFAKNQLKKFKKI